MKNKIIIALALSCALHLMPTAQAALPTVTTLAVSNLTATTVMLNGTVNPNSAATTANFQYGPTPTLGPAGTLYNPSFESNNFTVFPGYASDNGGVISGWVLSSPSSIGLNPATDSVFANNGATPDGANVAFLDNSSFTGQRSLSTTISNLSVGGVYTVRFRANAYAATAAQPPPNPTWSLNGGAFVPLTASPAVGGTNAYYTNSGTFTATNTTAALVLANNHTNATKQSVLLVDAFTISNGSSSTDSTNLGAGTAVLSVSNQLSGLQPATTYYYRLYATNSGGAGSGTIQSFTTPVAVPSVTTLAVTGITTTNATLNASVNPNGAASKAWFQYGLTTNYGNYSATNTLVATNITLNVTNLLGGLAPGTLYHSRLVATNSAGIYYGSDITLTTLSLDTQFVNPNNPTPAFPYSSWVTAATNLQDAINAAVAGNTVLVTNGVYGVGTTPDDQAYDNRVLINKAITVRSVNGPSFTTIIGGSSIRCVWMTNGALLAGFTLTNGNVTSFGGGVYAASAQVVISNCWITGSRGINAGGVYRGTLYDCTLTNNYATGDGGGGYSNTLYRCTLIGNTSDGFGGGLSYGILSSCLLISNKTTQSSSDGGGANASTLTHCTLLGNNAFNGGGVVNSTLVNCALSNNTARSYGGGGMSSTLSACTLFGNKSQKDGGGAHTCTLTNCTLSNNTAGTTFSGGGAYSSTLDNCLVISNTATYGGGVANGTLLRCKLLKNTGTSQGGGGKSAAMNNCLIAGNTSVEGGGAYNGYFTNCTIAGNSTTYRGGGLYNASAVNCIVYLNTGGSVNYLNYYFGVFANSCTLPLPSSGSGNIDTDPQFVNAGIDDYHLQASSPCRNTGDNAYVTTALDLDANPRIIAAIVDMGAYESQVTNAPVAFSLTGTPLSAGGGFQLSFTNVTGLGFTALGTTNLAVPLTNWTVLGPVAETPAGSGNYQFNDTQNTNRATQYYRVRSP